MAILTLYLLSYTGGVLTKENRLRIIAFVTAGCCCYVAVLILCGKGNWYYNTIFCYPIGMLYGEYEWKIKKLLEKAGTFLFLTAGCAVVFTVSYICALKWHGVLWLAAVELRGIFFVLLVVLMTSRLQVGNPMLNWLGKYTFEIYMLQRLPMVAFDEIDMNQYVYFGICAAITGLAAVLFQRTAEKIKVSHRVL